MMTKQALVRPSRLPVLLAILMLGGAAHAQVWKCTVNGQTRYSDRPCATPGQGQAMSQRALQANTLDASGSRESAARLNDAAASAAELADAANDGQRGQAPTVPANVCPSDKDIANMETRAGSNSLSHEAKTFMQDEVRRARQCRKGQGRYSEADWQVSRQAQDAQSSLTGAAAARRRAEGVHSAADAAEADRIARQQAAQRREAERREQRELRERAPLLPAAPAAPAVAASSAPRINH